jgi:hypothetical protein
MDVARVSARQTPQTDGGHRDMLVGRHTRGVIGCTDADRGRAPRVVIGPNESGISTAVNGAMARERLPHACFMALPGVGHVVMIDDPALVPRPSSM